MVKKLLYGLVFNYFIVIPVFSQDSIQKPRQIFFGNIFADFYHDFNNNTKPPSGFEMATALFGMHTDLSKKVKAQLIYDVTRTTNDIQVLDSNNTALTVNYFEGSKYTAFLKQAEMDWMFAPHFELDVGQLLNQQYLTVQDKFWGYRFVAVTFQEMYRFGNPADFGMRLTYHLKDKLNWSVGSVNGEGPFRHQDEKGNLQYFNNIEYMPNDKWMIKLYSDYEPDGNQFRSANALFVSYKAKNLRVGLEYNRVDFNKIQSENNLEGLSLYQSIKLTEKLDIFWRYDGLMNYTLFDHEHKLFGGFCYSEGKFQTALNVRYFTYDKSLMLYWSFGVKY